MLDAESYLLFVDGNDPDVGRSSLLLGTIATDDRMRGCVVGQRLDKGVRSAGSPVSSGRPLFVRNAPSRLFSYVFDAFSRRRIQRREANDGRVDFVLRAIGVESRGLDLRIQGNWAGGGRSGT